MIGNNAIHGANVHTILREFGMSREGSHYRKGPISTVCSRWKDTRAYLTPSGIETVDALHNFFAPAVIVDHHVQLTVSHGKSDKFSRPEHVARYVLPYTTPSHV